LATTQKSTAKRSKTKTKPVVKKTAAGAKKTVKKTTVKPRPVKKKTTGKKIKAGSPKTKKSVQKTKNKVTRQTPKTKKNLLHPKPLHEVKPQEPDSAMSPVREQSLKLADTIARVMFEKKAEDVVILDLGELTSAMDCFIIATGSSDVHVQAIADHVIDVLERDNIRPHHREGCESLKWILLDYIDVVVHVFQKETREFYGLERLWGDARMIKMTDRI
jgi:ribosome-associated protein